MFVCLCRHTGCILDTRWVYLFSAAVCCFCRATVTKRDGEGKKRGIKWSPLCVIRRATRVPGVWHGLAPVITELLLWLRNSHLYPSLAPPPFPHRQPSEREVGRQSDRQKERVQTEAMWVCVIWNRFSANDRPTPHSPTLCPPSATHSSNPHHTSLRPGQYHPFIRNAGLFQLQCPMATPIQALICLNLLTLPCFPSWSYPALRLDTWTQVRL